MSMPTITVDGVPDDGDERGMQINDAYIEYGATGLRRWSGIVDEEFLPALKGRKAVKVFKEMADNDPIVGALLYTFDMLLREVEWTVTPASGDYNDILAAQFVEECMDDMSQTWDDFISEILSMLIFGWSWHEVVYKRRVGDVKNPALKSKFSDGLIGWRKMPIRAQETLFQWQFDDDGGIQGMTQMAPPDYKQVTIPIDKSLLFRVHTRKNNPEGRSLLRNAYRPWYFKKRMEEIEGIGVERDLAGLPYAKIPASMLNAAPGSKEAKVADAFKKMVRGVRRDEQEGLVIPSEVDPDSKQPLFDFQLLTSGGGRQFDTNAIIERYEQRILMSVLADFIMVGHDETGSYALHTDKTGIFRASLNAITNSIAGVMNRYELPRLFALNGWQLDKLPEITPSDVDPPDLTELAGYLQSLSSVGMTLFPDPELETFLRKIARLPEKSPEAEMLQEQQRQVDALNAANASMSGGSDGSEQDSQDAQNPQGDLGPDPGNDWNEDI